MAAILAEAQLKGVWLDRWRVEEAEYKYQEYLVRSLAGGESNKVKGGDKSVVIGDKTVVSSCMVVASCVYAYFSCLTWDVQFVACMSMLLLAHAL